MTLRDTEIPIHYKAAFIKYLNTLEEEAYKELHIAEKNASKDYNNFDRWQHIAEGATWVLNKAKVDWK